ncbi:MAG TPA: hypothetical protein VET89_11730 [Stellaceae bacterium]|nr:hypothetical protein [Stellaceae bacterium]
MNSRIASFITAVSVAIVLAVPAARADIGSRAGNVPPELVTNGPQATPGDESPRWSAERNVAESDQYEHLLKASPGFRHARIQKECGPIDDPALHQQCVSSFR